MSSSTSMMMGSSSGGGGGGSGSGGGVDLAGASSKSATAAGQAMWQKEPKVHAELFALTYGALVSEIIRDYEDVNSIQNELDRMGHSIGIRCVEEVLAKSENYGYNLHSFFSNISSASSSRGAVNNAARAAFQESAEIIKIAFRMFLCVGVDIVSPASSSKDAKNREESNAENVVIDSAGSSNDDVAVEKDEAAAEAAAAAAPVNSFGLKFTDNPLALFVELPENPSSATSANLQGTSSSSSLHTLEYNQLLVGMCRGMLEMLQLECNCSMTSSILAGDDHYEIGVHLQRFVSQGAGEDYQEE